jgi:hypothetical protein
MIAQKKILAAVIVAATCALAPAGSASATPVVLGGSSTWNSWTTSQLLSGQFWANWSYDRNGLANIGYFVSGMPGSDVPGFLAASPDGTLPYLGDGSTTFALLLTDTSQPTDFGHLLSITGWNDEFGLFNVATGDKYPLFQAWYTKGLTTSFYPVGTYGFYLSNGEGRTWTSTTLDGGRNHFAIFQDGGNEWYLGVEDATYTTPRPADWDYNDMVIKWAEPVPEVGTMSMMGLGLLSLRVALRRWRR